MTWKIRTRGHGGMMVSEYECPEHGRFSATVQRDADGNPPDEIACSDLVERYGITRSLVDYCGLTSPWRISAPLSRVKAGEVIRGKSDPRPPDSVVMDTSVLADGMPYDEFKRRRAKVHADESLRRVRKALGRGPKVFV